MGMAAGLSRSRLERMRRVLSGHIERKEIAGLVALVSHHDDVHVETLGTLSIDQPTPMKRDAIFRIASLSKPITPQLPRVFTDFWTLAYGAMD
jgi:CubicO group peptidase (beta-lactamase class C family)